MGDVTSSLVGGVAGTLTRGVIGSVSSKAGGSLIKIASNSVVRTIANNVNWGNVFSHVVDTMGFSKQQRIAHYSQPISKLSYGPSVYDQSVGDHYIPSTLLPAQFFESDAEVNEQKQRWAAYAIYMSKPFNYGSIYQYQLRELDQLGAINLGRTSREQIPGLQINYCCVMFINSYEGQSHSLGSEPLSDGLIMGRLFIERKYRVFYFYDATPIEYYRWMSWLIDMVDLQLVCYFSGRASQIADYTGKEKDGLLEVLQFTNESKRIQNKGEKIPNISGFTNETIEDTVVYELIRQKAFPQKRIILLTDYKYNQNQFKEEIPFQKLQTLKQPLPNVIYVGCGQIWTAGRNAGSQIMTSNNPGLFSWYFTQVLQWFKQTNFKQLYSELSQEKCQNQVLQIFAGDAGYLLKPIIATMGNDDEELQLNNITQYLGGRNPSQIISIPPVDSPSRIEIQIAQQRWGQFTSELKKEAPYQSEYKQQLQKLDSMGCINLERIYRAQIPPNIQIYNCLALFICPYEGLPHTLHDGPANDGILMAQFFLNKGYNVVYLCDATPHQYYKWMDWLLSNVKQELVSYFSGHGGQTPDRTGLESDGLSEVMVFYNAQKKKGSNKEKITNIVGISDDTVEDTVMHDLVISKDYPKTRIVLLSDCCHSGTMFNLDQPWPPKGKLMAPITQRLNIIHVGAAVDSQTAKQKTQGGMACGAFTYSLINLLKSNPRSSFKDLEAYCLRNIIKDQVVQLTATDMNNLNQQIIISRR